MIFYSLFELFSLKEWLIFTAVFLFFIHIIWNKNPPNFPPGPPPLPFLGNVFTGVDYKTMNKLAEKYGNVFSLRRGTTKIVYVFGYNMVKKALQEERFARYVTPLFDEIYKGRGLSFTNGYAWKKHQQFSIGFLKSFGESREALQHTIHQECHYLCEAFKEEHGCPFYPLFKINNAVANVIGTLVFGHRHEYDDAQFQKLLRMSAESVHLTGSVWNEWYDAYPSIMKLVPGPHHTIIANYRRLAAFLREKIDKHKQDLGVDEPKDYIYSYLTEIEKRRNDKEVQFSRENLEWCIVDLFEGGTETTTNTLCWALLFMINYPLIQEKVQEEIESVIGQIRLPTMADKANMPYTNAVLHEVLRKCDMVPLNMARVATTDTTLGGYLITKGTVMIASLSSVLSDKHEWQTPNTFNPEHFLDSEGHFCRRDAFLPFSAGTVRGCVLVSTWLVWNCSWSSPASCKNLHLNLHLEKSPIWMLSSVLRRSPCRISCAPPNDEVMDLTYCLRNMYKVINIELY